MNHLRFMIRYNKIIHVCTWLNMLNALSDICILFSPRFTSNHSHMENEEWLEEKKSKEDWALIDWQCGLLLFGEKINFNFNIEYLVSDIDILAWGNSIVHDTLCDKISWRFCFEIHNVLGKQYVLGWEWLFPWESQTINFYEHLQWNYRWGNTWNRNQTMQLLWMPVVELHAFEGSIAFPLKFELKKVKTKIKNIVLLKRKYHPHVLLFFNQIY